MDNTIPTSIVSKMLKLISSDGQEFEVEEKVVTLSETLRNMVDGDTSSSRTISLPDVNSTALSVVIKYLEKHTEHDGNDLDAFDKGLVDGLEPQQPLLFATVIAAYSLKIKGLLDISSQKVADVVKGKTTEEMRQVFAIQNDFTPEEEEEIRRKNAWAFE